MDGFGDLFIRSAHLLRTREVGDRSRLAVIREDQR